MPVVKYQIDLNLLIVKLIARVRRKFNSALNAYTIASMNTEEHLIQYKSFEIRHGGNKGT